MKEFYHPSWVKWRLMVDPLEYNHKELEEIINKTNLVSWYFDQNIDVGMAFVIGRLKFEEAYKFAKAYKETFEVLAEHGGKVGDA